MNIQENNLKSLFRTIVCPWSILPELHRRIKLSLLFPVDSSDTTLENITLSRDGYRFDKIFDYFKSNYDELTTIGLKELMMSKLAQTFKEHDELTLIINEVSALIQAPQAEKNKIIAVGTTRSQSFGIAETFAHAEGLLLFDDLIMKINRGARSSSQESGITIFQATHEVRSSEEDDWLSKLSTGRATTSISGVELDLQIDKMGKQSHVLRMQKQSVGNCTWATSKAFVLGAYYAVIRKHLLARGITEPDLHATSEKLAISCYKTYSNFNRLTEAKNYLEIHAATDYKYADREIIDKMIDHHFKEPSMQKIILESNYLSFASPGTVHECLKKAIENDYIELAKLCLSLTTQPITPRSKLSLLNSAIENNATSILQQFDFGVDLNKIRIQGLHPLSKCIDSRRPDAFKVLFTRVEPIPYKEIIDVLNAELSKINYGSARLGVVPDLQAQLDALSKIQATIVEHFMSDTQKTIEKLLTGKEDSSVILQRLAEIKNERIIMFQKLTAGLTDQAILIDFITKIFDSTREKISQSMHEPPSMLTQFQSSKGSASELKGSDSNPSSVDQPQPKIR